LNDGRAEAFVHELIYRRAAALNPAQDEPPARQAARSPQLGPQARTEIHNEQASRERSARLSLDHRKRARIGFMTEVKIVLECASNRTHCDPVRGFAILVPFGQFLGSLPRYLSSLLYYYMNQPGYVNSKHWPLLRLVERQRQWPKWKAAQQAHGGRGLRARADVQRMIWDDFRRLSAGGAERDAMDLAVIKLRKALAEAGFDPR
jgi:hypothetical protein